MDTTGLGWGSVTGSCEYSNESLDSESKITKRQSVGRSVNQPVSQSVSQPVS